MFKVRISKIMLLGNEKLNVEIVKKELNPIFKKYGIKSAILYGSVAKNENTIDSDVDLLVDSSLKGFNFLSLVEDIREALNKSVDVLDVKHIIKNSMIDNEIKKTGVLIYD